MEESIAESARTRHHAILKVVVDKINKLTSNAESTSLFVYRDELDLCWSNYAVAYRAHEEFVASKDQAKLANILKEYLAIHDSYLSSKLHANKLLAANPTNSIFDGNSTQRMAEQSKPVKLKPYHITTFSGEIKDWNEFKATCQTILTEEMPDVQRLQHLKNALEGEPRELVSHILPADGAYDKAMFLLKSRYENARAIVNEHLRQLYSLERNEPANESLVLLRKIINTINGLKAALNGCDVDVSTWDSILIYNTSQCLHPNSLRAWEERLEGKRAIPTLDGYLNFLEARIAIIENTSTFATANREYRHRSEQRPNMRDNGYKADKEKVKTFYTLKADFKCALCQKNHLTTRCEEIYRMPHRERRAAVHKGGVCFNCLQPHLVAQCPFESTCKKCDGIHHTALHEDRPVLLNQAEEAVSTEDIRKELDERMSELSFANFFHLSMKSITILATALIPIRYNGRSIMLRALIDQGSTANLITDRACQMLRLPKISANIPMTGIGDSPVGLVLAKTLFTFGSAYDVNYQHRVPSIVVKSITKVSGINPKDVHGWNHLKNIQLADPQFFGSHKIDLLLGASAYAEIILGDIKRGTTDQPIAQSTKLGWIVFGTARVDENYIELCNAMQTNQSPSAEGNNLSSQMQRFWQIEEIEDTKYLTPDEQAAEDIFATSLRRDIDGKFIVDLPFKVDPNSNCLGESKVLAEKRFYAAEKRLSKNPMLKQMYDANLNEYLTLGHMMEVEEGEEPRYFMPHHPVIKESSTTTKVRTVFDGSAKSSNGRSLNDIVRRSNHSTRYLRPVFAMAAFSIRILRRLRKNVSTGKGKFFPRTFSMYFGKRSNLESSQNIQIVNSDIRNCQRCISGHTRCR